MTTSIKQVVDSLSVNGELAKQLLLIIGNSKQNLLIFLDKFYSGRSTKYFSEVQAFRGYMQQQGEQISKLGFTDLVSSQSPGSNEIAIEKLFLFPADLETIDALETNLAKGAFTAEELFDAHFQWPHLVPFRVIRQLSHF